VVSDYDWLLRIELREMYL